MSSRQIFTLQAQRLYEETFSQRRCPIKNIFSSVHYRLREIGSPSPTIVNQGRHRYARTSIGEEQVDT